MKMRPSKQHRFKMQVFKELMSAGYYTIDSSKPIKVAESRIKERIIRINHVIGHIYRLEKCGYIDVIPGKEYIMIKYNIRVRLKTTARETIKEAGSIMPIQNEFYYPKINKIFGLE